MAKPVLCHPVEKRPLTPDEFAYVNQCSIAAMQGYIARNGIGEDELVQLSWNLALKMLVQRDRLRKYCG